MRIIAELLTDFAACPEAVKWSQSYGTDYQRAWDECQHGAWLLWILGKGVKSQPWSDDRKPLLACALDCACTVEHLWPDKRRKTVGDIVATLRGWIEDGMTIEEAKKATLGLQECDCYSLEALRASVYGVTSLLSAFRVWAVVMYATWASGGKVTTLQHQTAKIVRAHFPLAPVEAITC